MPTTVLMCVKYGDVRHICIHVYIYMYMSEALIWYQTHSLLSRCYSCSKDL